MEPGTANRPRPLYNRPSTPIEVKNENEKKIAFYAKRIRAAVDDEDEEKVSKRKMVSTNKDLTSIFLCLFIVTAAGDGPKKKPCTSSIV